MSNSFKLYRIRNWDLHFEGSKSRTYNNKTSCSLPCKHGLGYKRLIRSKDGAALFGAWCALIQVLSRHNKPRKGYCTNDGTSSGNPYTPDDLELMTDIPAKFFESMLIICSSKTVGWVDVTYNKGSAVPCEATIVPLNLDSDLDSDIYSDSDSTKSAPSARVVALEIIDYYNSNRGNMAECTKATPQRISAINARIKNSGGKESVIAVIDSANSSDFLQGLTDACFSCGIDWIMKSSNFFKITEGNYRNKTKISKPIEIDPEDAF